jgi:hypothetical protein
MIKSKILLEMIFLNIKNKNQKLIKFSINFMTMSQMKMYNKQLIFFKIPFKIHLKRMKINSKAY